MSNKNVFNQKFGHHPSIISGSCHFLYPLRDIVYSHQHVHISRRLWEWSHEVNASHIKKLYFKDVSKRHILPHGDTPYSLIYITVFLPILELLLKERAINNMKNFGRSSGSSIRSLMTGKQDPFSFGSHIF